MKFYYYFFSLVMDKCCELYELENTFLKVCDKFSRIIEAILLVEDTNPKHIHAIFVCTKPINYTILSRIIGYGFSYTIELLRTKLDLKNATRYIEMHKGRKANYNYTNHILNKL